MTLYSDNPRLKLKTVITVRNTTEYRRNCRKLRDRYYVENIDCFEINKRWYAKTSKLITFDYERKEWVLIKTNKLYYGIVGFESDNTAKFGYFTENKYNNVFVHVGNYGTVKALSAEILERCGYIEHISTGIFHYKKSLTPAKLSKMSAIEGRKVYREQGYNIEDNATEFREKIEAYENYPIKISHAAAKYGKMLGVTTFGCEIETSMGWLPEHIQNRTGVVICRDGSIDNAEYVTVPLQGAKGLENLKYLFHELRKRTLTDIKCSLHFHLGTIPTDRLFIVSLYALSVRIQDELFKMFPFYKTEPQGIKKKNYNQKLRKLGTTTLSPNATKEQFTRYVDEAYYRIFTFLNDGNPPDDRWNRNNHQHNHRHKWERSSRYFWNNLMNMFFSERNTAEFRIHQGTLNTQKVINWLFICNAIVKYAEKNSKNILSGSSHISLKQVLNYYGENFKTKDAIFLSDYLNAYVAERKDYFLSDYKAEDFISGQEQADDKTYEFEYKGTSLLF
jgi:Putative amidoligase enzyme.